MFWNIKNRKGKNKNKKIFNDANKLYLPFPHRFAIAPAIIRNVCISFVLYVRFAKSRPPPLFIINIWFASDYISFRISINIWLNSKDATLKKQIFEQINQIRGKTEK